MYCKKTQSTEQNRNLLTISIQWREKYILNNCNNTFQQIRTLNTGRQLKALTY